MWNNAELRIVKTNDNRIATGRIAVYLKKKIKITPAENLTCIQLRPG